MPPRTSEFAVGGEFEADLLLLPDDCLDFAVFDRLERAGVNLASEMLGSRLFQRPGAQETADVISAKGRRCALGHLYLDVIFVRPSSRASVSETRDHTLQS
jgi:hypothetical protein